jgi:DNA-binding transcriptional regulator YbjK
METSKERLERLMQNPAFRKMMEAEMQAEQNYEMTAAFGSGVKLVNVVTGKKITTK